MRPKPGQILLITMRLGSSKQRSYFRYLVVVLNAQRDWFGRTVFTRVVAVNDPPSDFLADSNPIVAGLIMVDALREININDLKARGHKVERVGIEVSTTVHIMEPRCYL
jgi:hypothetical protein